MILSTAPQLPAFPPINEVFGPTLQGEGPLTGHPCMFLRVHHCPVKCPGCDTHFTWDSSESAMPQQTVETVLDDLRQTLSRAKMHLVVSGGEPLLYYRNSTFVRYLQSLQVPLALETSGFLGNAPMLSRFWGNGSYSDLDGFLSIFTSVVVSPKVTPCLHGAGWTNDELLRNVPTILSSCSGQGVPVALKFVVRDQEDIAAVEQSLEMIPNRKSTLIYAMPYGQEPQELIDTTKALLPECAKRGWVLTPRLQCLLWGKRRGV